MGFGYDEEDYGGMLADMDYDDRNPDCCECCPFVDYEKETKTRQFCLVIGQYFSNNHICHIPVNKLHKFTMKQKEG